MAKSRNIFLLFALFAFCGPVGAQITPGGNEPASVWWYEMHTSNFRVIYPQGYDFLAASYLKELEKFRPKVAESLQMISGQYQRKPLDVILHTHNAASNGIVTWTPSRMELYSLPQWNNPDPMPWITQLAVHEGRHAAQMQLGYRRVFKPFYYILGQMVPGAACAWPGSLLLEGDAVVAETALTNSGRGRRADFLMYYMYSFDNGDMRNWMRWRMGSYYRYTPDHYAFGYLLISGMRTFYNAPLFMADYMDYVSRRPYDPWPLRHAMRRTTGMKFRKNLSSIMDGHYRIWAADTLKRGPFNASEPLKKAPRVLTEYSAPSAVPGAVLWKKNDIFHLPSLVSIDSSTVERRLFNLPSSVDKVNASSDGKTLYWNELRRHPRWNEVQYSAIRVYDADRKRQRTLKLRKAMYIHPVQYSGDTLAVIVYKEKGGSRIDFYNSSNSQAYRKWDVPDTLQPVQMAVSGRELFVSAISDGGFGLWKTDGKRWIEILAPQHVTLTSISAEPDNRIAFCSDRTGVNEYYSYDTRTGVLERLTSTLYGGIDFVRASDGGVQYAEYGARGSVLKRINNLSPEPVDWSEHYRYPVADTLSAQEASLARVSEHQMPEDSISTPKWYHKGAHAFRFHSWAPCYIDINNVANISYENIKNIASLGVMALFQNSMSTLYGYAGYKAAPDSKGRWFHSGHLNLTYSGLYPVFEAQVHVGERQPVEYFHKEGITDTLYYRYSSKPSVRASLKTYVPLSWNRGGMVYGFIPEVELSYSNNRYDGKHQLLFNVSARAYAMQTTPSACIYPRWGIGTELLYSPAASFAFLYGYVPGFCYGQGLKLSTVLQVCPSAYQGFVGSYANLFPRGFVNYGGERLCSGIKFTADYAIPFYMGDWHIFDMFYCKRGIVTPHFDWSAPNFAGPLYSVGATFEMEFAAFFWVKTPVTVGVTYSYNGGGLFSALNMKSHHYVGATFNISLPN